MKHRRTETTSLENAQRQLDVNVLGLARMTSTEKATKHVCKAVTSRHPKTRYAFGIGNASMRFLHTLLPARWFDRIILFLFNYFGKQ